MKRFLLIATALAWVPGHVGAQLTQMHAGSDTRYGVELSRGFFEGDGLAWYTSTLRGRVLTPISPSARLLVDVGLSIAGVDGAGTDGTFANPELGVVFVDEDNESRGHLTVVVPVGFDFGDDDVSAGTGLLTDFFRPDRYLSDLVSINAGVTPRAEVGPSTDLTAEITAAAIIPRNDGDSELFTRYALGIAHDTPAVRLSGGVQGFAILTQGDLSISERTIHRLVFAVAGVRGGPGFFAQGPIDDALDGIDAVAGFTFTF